MTHGWQYDTCLLFSLSLVPRVNVSTCGQDIVRENFNGVEKYTAHHMDWRITMVTPFFQQYTLPQFWHLAHAGCLKLTVTWRNLSLPRPSRHVRASYLIARKIKNYLHALGLRNIFSQNRCIRTYPLVVIKHWDSHLRNPHALNSSD